MGKRYKMIPALQTITHVTLYDAGGPSLPVSHEVEDVEAWLAAPEPESIVVQLGASQTLTPGDSLSIAPGSLEISTS